MDVVSKIALSILNYRYNGKLQNPGYPSANAYFSFGPMLALTVMLTGI